MGWITRTQYSTVQNWYPGTETARAGLHLVTKRGACRGRPADQWTRRDRRPSLEVPEPHLQGDDSVGEF